MAIRQFAITTDDNKYDPITEFDEWYNEDQYVKGYRTCDILARLAHTSKDLPDELNDLEIERAIDDMRKYLFAVGRDGRVHKYVKVVHM